MLVLLSDVIVTGAEKVVVVVRKVETLVSRGLQVILKAQIEAHTNYINNHRAKNERILAEAQAEIKEILENAQAKAERIGFEANTVYWDALSERCKIIDKKNDLRAKFRKGL